MNYKKIAINVGSYLLAGVVGYLIGKNTCITKQNETNKEVNELSMVYQEAFEYNIEGKEYVVNHSLNIDTNGTYIDKIKISEQKVSDMSSFNIIVNNNDVNCDMQNKQDEKVEKQIS
jgi:hypothetical protein